MAQFTIQHGYPYNPTATFIARRVHLERGYQIHEVAQFTLHDSWNELKRYAHVRPGAAKELRADPEPVLATDRLKPE